MSNITVREATEEDAIGLAEVTACAREALRQTYRPTAKALASKKCVGPELTQLVAVQDSRVVGGVQYSIKADRVHLLSLDVLAACRRQGIARRLIEELTRIGKRAGAAKLSTYTVTQTGNVAIFVRLGFHVVLEEATDFFESDQYAVLTEAYLERPITR